MRVGVGKRAAQTFAAKHHHEAVTFAGFDDDFDVGDLLDLLLQYLDLRLAHTGVDAAGTTIGHEAFDVERTEIRPRRHVTGLEIDSQPERFNHAAADIVVEWVVAEQAEVTG